MTTDLETVLGDLLRSALDDVDVLLPRVVERRIVERMAELAEISGWTIVASTTNTTSD